MLKKILFLLSVVFISLYGDIIPPNTHVVSRKVTITNLNDYPDVVLFSYDSHPMNYPDFTPQVIEGNISAGFKSLPVNIFALSKTVYENIGSANQIVMDKIIEEKKFATIPGSGSPRVYDKYPILSDTYYYKITSVTDDNVALKLKKRVITFNNGTPDKTIEY